MTLAPLTKVFATIPLALEQPAVELTVKTIPVALATDPAKEAVPSADSTTDAGMVTLIPGVWTTPTVTVLVPVGAGNARMVMVWPTSGGPVTVEQVTPATGIAATFATSVFVSRVVACMLPAQTVKATNPPSASVLRLLNTDKSMEDLPFPGVFSTTSRGGDQSSNRYRTYRRASAML